VQAKQLHNWMPEQPRQSWLAVTLQILAATILSGGIAYLATNPERPVHIGTPALAQPVAPHIAPLSRATGAPVRLRNLFDPAEIFEFPPGTSEIEARRAVAATLMQRAHDRQHLWATNTRGRKAVRAARIGDGNQAWKNSVGQTRTHLQ
jgi:hypothetical protein